MRKPDLESLQKFMQDGLNVTLKRTAEKMNAQATDGGVFISNAVNNQMNTLKLQYRRISGG